MRLWLGLLALALAGAGGGPNARADTPRGAGGSKPWCAPEVSELSERVCFFDGGSPADGRRTLVIYLHGVYGTSPGFQWLQQRGMALHAKRLGFTVLLPTAPRVPGGYAWPASRAAEEAQEARVVEGLKEARGELERRLGHGFDETFVVGFSSGAYYASSLAVRDALDVDGYIVLAGGSSWVRSEGPAARRAPVFVGISAADRYTAPHSRALAGALASMGYPYRAEERNAGHMVDWAFMTHGIQWLRSRTRTASTAIAETAPAPQ
jgi:predicted esterase